jgi:RNA polymerase subunit RPABC4/transcription elongation factor Spt4
MEVTTVSPDEIIGRLAELGVETGTGASTTAYTDLGTQVNLNAIAIGAGLDEVMYEPETFPGVVYELEAYDGTVAVVFGNGTLFVDSTGSVGVHEIADEITTQLAELGLVPDPDPGREFSLTPTEVPVPVEFGEQASEPAGNATGSTSTDDVGACAECGHGLTGEENFCPECGAEVASNCPSCGYDLAGEEKFCPECGAEVAAD